MSSTVTPDRTQRHATTTVQSGTDIQVQVIENMWLLFVLKTQYQY